MADNLPVTPGSGAIVSADDVGGVLYQRVKLDVGGDGATIPLTGDNANGLDVDVTRVSGDVSTKPKALEVWPVNDNGGTLSVDDGAASLTVDAPAAAPVAVRLSDGAAFIGGLPVSGTVTADQGAANTTPWAMKISDGSSVVEIADVSGEKAIKAKVIETVGPAAQSDKQTFTEGTSQILVIGGEYQTAPSAPTSGKAAAARVTQSRALHANLRNDAGTEIGTSANPVRTDPTGTTPQPVSGTVAATQSGAWVDNITKVAGANVVSAAAGIMAVGVVDGAGAAFSNTNPLPTMPALIAGRTRVSKSVSLSASQTAAALWTPTSGKKFVITSMDLLISVTGALTIFDGTNAAGNLLVDGVSGAWTVGRHIFNFQAIPWPSSTVDNVLKYTSGTGLTGVLTMHGYEV